jgi:prepilin-type N-terminal cleavage/methylation domain-containing protein
MSRRDMLPASTPLPLPPGEGRGEGARPGFTLTELLVVISIVLVLVSLIGAGVSAARGSQKKQATRALIAKLDAIIQQHAISYDTRSVDMSACPAGVSKSAYRAWYIRRNLITGDLPDRWTDVQFMAANPSQFTTRHQRTYIAIWNALGSDKQTQVMANNASAECLFMIIMQGGIADCLDCGSLAISEVGDQDGDGMPEFWDAWRNPIGLLLWAPALELPSGSGTRFFSDSRALDPPWSGNPRPSLGMRPLIYSVGADGKSGLDRHSTIIGSSPNESKTDIANLSFGSTPLVGWGCGDYSINTPINANSSAFSASGGKDTKPLPPNDIVDYRADNITNFDGEVGR